MPDSKKNEAIEGLLNRGVNSEFLAENTNLNGGNDAGNGKNPPPSNEPKKSLNKAKKKKRRNKNRNKNQLAQVYQVPNDQQIPPQEILDKGSGNYVNSTTNLEQTDIYRSFEPPKVAKPLDLSIQPTIREGEELETQRLNSGTISPRKQTLMRHKKSTNLTNEPLTTLKDNLRAKTEIPVELPKESPLQLDMDEKVTLFKFKSSKVLVFDEQLNQKTNSSGRLLGHGELEIFQLHNGDVTYLSCGTSLIYPLLPKIKIFRVALNEFVLPLVNPERHWKIFVNSDEFNVFEILERTLSGLVQYKNLLQTEKTLSHGISSLDLNGNSQPHATDPSENLLVDLSQEIPDSPPSAPLSPGGPTHLYIPQSLPTTENMHLPPGWSLNKLANEYNEGPKNMTKHSRMFHFNDSKQRPEIGTNSHNRHRSVDKKSDSSMDSLLDEYEENVSVTNLVTFTRSRPQSRTMSVASSYRRPPNISRPIMPSAFEDNASDLEDFPKTSLSEYNRRHNGSKQKSLASSRSGINADFSALARKTLPKSQSNYSLRSSINNQDLRTTYGDIYRSIAQKNLNGVVDDSSSLRSKRMNHSPRPQKDFLHSENNRYRGPRLGAAPSESRKLDLRFTLQSRDIYKLVSSNRNGDPPNGDRPSRKKNEHLSIASRLFGW